jgi:lambda family phage portal protein
VSLLEKIGDGLARVAYGKKYAALRAHAREMKRNEDYFRAFDLLARARGYKHAMPGKNKTPWQHASDLSADSEIVPSLRNLRNRSRAAFRDDSIAAGVHRTFVNNVVGTGLVPQAKAKGADGKLDRKKNEALEAVWKSRANHLAPADGGLSHGIHQRLVYGAQLGDGDVLLKASISRPGEPVWFETVEGQRLSTPANAFPLDPGGRIVNGVEKDALGRVVAYWVRKADPADIVLQDTAGQKPPQGNSKEYFERLPVGPMVRHVRHGVTRPSQSRGVGFLHACLQDLLDLDLLFFAALKRTQIAACLSMFIKSAVDNLDLIEMTAEDYGYQLDQKLEPGLIFRLYPGESVEKVEPGMPFADLWPLFLFAARRIGASVGLSPQAVLKAWDDTSYAGARTILLDDRNTYRCERTDFDDQVLDWEWKVVQEDALMRGDERLLEAGVQMEDLELVDWIGNGEPWVDPVAEAQAIQIMLQLKLTTPQAECAKLGLDWRDNLRASIEYEMAEIELRKEMGAPEKPAADPATFKVVPGGKPAPAGFGKEAA